MNFFLNKKNILAVVMTCAAAAAFPQATAETKTYDESEQVQTDDGKVEISSELKTEDAAVNAKNKSFRRGLEETVPASSFVYDALTELKLNAGMADFSDAYPLTVREIRNYLFEVDYNSLSDSAKRCYDSIIDYLNHGYFGITSSIFTVKIEPEFNFEGYYKSNDNLTWVCNRYQRSKLLYAPLILNGGDYFSYMADMSIGESKYFMDKISGYNFTNFPWPLTEDFDVNFPHETVSSMGTNFTEDTGINFSIGNTPRSVGRTLLGSSIMSTYCTGINFAELSVYSPDIKWVSGVSEINVNRYYYSHRGDFRLFDRFTFSVLEGTLVYAPLELRYLNPFTIFHSFFPMRDYSKTSNDSHDCAIMAFKAEFVPVKNWRIYGLFMQDQFQTYHEKLNWPDDPTPNAMGGQLGFEGYIPLNEGSFHIAAEAYYAEPYLYIKQSPNWSFIRTYHEDLFDTVTYYEWIGSPFGPDTAAGEIKFGYDSHKNWSVEGTYLFAARGEMSDKAIEALYGLNWGTPGNRDLGLYDSDGNSKDDTLGTSWVYPVREDPDYTTKRDSIAPTGTPEFVNAVSIKGTYRLNKGISFTLMPAVKFVFNSGHTAGNTQVGAEISAGTKIDFGRLWNFAFPLNFKFLKK